MPPEPGSGVFQSHAGSIEAVGVGVAAGVGVGGFNPTLVRLRPGGDGGANGDGLRFNPTLVRLRPGELDWEDRILLLFQSHAGSIEALAGLGAEFYFDPVFQSHAGSIEAQRTQQRSEQG